MSNLEQRRFREATNQLRREKYHQLISSGFTRLEATKYKDRAKKTVEALCDVKTKHEEELLNELEGILGRKKSK